MANRSKYKLEDVAMTSSCHQDSCKLHCRVSVYATKAISTQRLCPWEANPPLVLTMREHGRCLLSHGKTWCGTPGEGAEDGIHTEDTGRAQAGSRCT